MPPPKENPLTQGIAVVRKMVKCGHSLGVTALAREMGMPKSSVHRLLQTLVALGFVQKAGTTGRYALCADLFGFVHEIASSFGKNLRLDGLLRGAVRRLDCSVYLGMLGRHDAYVIWGAGEEGGTARLGIRAPVHRSSAGKILAAQQERRQWPGYLPSGAARERRRFLAELRAARKAGIAWNRGESSPDHVSLAATVREPFLSLPRLAVALVLRQEAFEERAKAAPGELETSLLALAAELERELGSR